MTDEKAKAQLIELERRRCEMLEGAVDRAALAELCDEDLVYLHGTGKMENKETHVRDIGPRHVDRGELDVRVYGDFAVMIGPMAHYRPGQEPIHSIVTQNWIRRPSGWKLLTFQVARPAPHIPYP